MMTQAAVEMLTFIADCSSSVSEELYFSIINEKYEEVSSKLKNVGIEFENLGDNVICIDNSFFSQQRILPYCSTDSFFRNYDDTDMSILILGNKDTNSLISSTSDGYTFFQKMKTNKIDHDTTNYLYLTKIIGILSQPNVTDYKDSAHKRYFFLSPDCGKLEVYEGDYTNLIKISQEKYNLFETYKKFKTLCEYPKGWELILKNKIIRGLENVDIEKDGFKELILNLHLFIDATERDYELFLVSRKHETIVQNFISEKYTFADKIRSVLQRISGSIVSIPLTFFGAAFAMKEINQLWLLNIIIVSMLLYIVFTSVANFLLWGDLNILKDEITTKKKIISMGLPRLNKDLNDIMKPIYIRIIALRILIIGTIFLFALIFAFFVYQYTVNNIPIIVNLSV
jgi:hypothetical protein